MTLSLALALAFTLALPATGCAPPGDEEAAAAPPAGPGIPVADLTGAEPPVARRIESTLESVRSAPGSAPLWGLLGMDYHAHGFREEAASCYDRASGLDPSDPRWPYLAALSLATADPAASLPWFRKAEEASPESHALLVKMGNALQATGRTDEARVRFQKAERDGPARPWALMGLARVALRQNLPEEAATFLESAAEAAPALGEIHKLRAQVLTRLGRKEEASFATLSAGLYPGESEVPDPILAEVRERGVSSRSWTRRGLRLQRLGRFAEAEEAFRRVLAIRSGNARDLSNLGGALARQDRIDEAIAEYRKALEVDPGEGYLLNNLAMALLKKGDPDRAENQFLEAMAVEPSFTEAPFNLGVMRARQDRAADAEALFKSVLKLDPAHRGALNSLATILAAAGRAGQAIELWSRAVRIDPLNLDAHYSLAVARMQRGDHAAAILQLESAMRSAPDSSLLSRILAWELATAPDPSLRRGERAVELATRVYSRYPSEPEVGDMMAAALAEDGQFARAIAMAEQAMNAAAQAGEQLLARQIRGRLELYRHGKAYRQPAVRAPAP